VMEPHSKRGAYGWMETVYRPQWEGLEVHHLYRALDVLHTVGSTLEEGLFDRVRDLFQLDLTLTRFDTTSTYFVGERPEGLADSATPETGGPTTGRPPVSKSGLREWWLMETSYHLAGSC